MPGWVAAGAWGFFAGAALILGALMGCFLPMRQRLIAAIMAFGSGVLISALSFELIEQADHQGGLTATGVGFVAGGALYTLANWAVSRSGAKHRKRSGNQQASEDDQNGSGLAIALGALLDGIPESIALGLTLLGGKGVSVVTVAAIFLSNIPEGLSSSAGMRKAHRSLVYIFGVWTTIALLSGLASLAGFLVFGGLSPAVISATTAVAAGAILAMLTDTMIPEAYENSHDFAGLITVAGFLLAYALSRLE